MCGITGIYAFNEIGRFNSIHLANATQKLNKRGPDAQNMSLHHYVNLGHARLSIIDLSTEANQPMQDETGRYTIVFNGEIFNFQEIKTRLESLGETFRTHSDTEVLLKAYMRFGADCLPMTNGFFAFAIYDSQTEELFLARDRMGVLPLLIYQDEDKLLFASEMKSLLAYNFAKELDYTALYAYLQLNYLPPQTTIFKNVRKLPAGHYLRISGRDKMEERPFYTIPSPEQTRLSLDYDVQKKQLSELLEASVKRRLIADVPLGCFLSGGIDSSVITALASRHTDKLNTFSIGYRDEKFFDETSYAQLVAKKFNTNHTIFSLTNQDLYGELFNMLDYIDEPFADSSALAVYILSKRTRNKVTVALSGDGADELFSGYNKHYGEYMMRKGGWKMNLLSSLLSLWKILPKSRQTPFGNKIRQFQRFAEGSRVGEKQRYWQWATFTDEGQARDLLSADSVGRLQETEYESLKNDILKHLHEGRGGEDFNEVLYTDMHLVLQGDMLTKVDLMSMGNSLEVRTPFLDYEVVNFVAQLPVASKIQGKMRKRILQDAFRDVLPAELYNRPKHGFEVPLLKWLRGELRDLLENDLLQDDFIREQNIFNVEEIKRLKTKLFSSNPEDIHARIWGLLVFQYWWKKYFV
jgi:asparagine synthase (glutamine-hydrolysing)